MDTIECTKCKRILPLTNEYFHKKTSSKTGFRNICKECRGCKPKTIKEGFKICSICGIEQSLDSFNNQATGYLGKRSYCRTCQNEKSKEYKKTDRAKELRSLWKKSEKGKLCNKRYRDNNKDKLKLYYTSEKVKIRHRISANNNRFGGNREIVLKRDEYKCVICGSMDNIQVHHKDNNGRNKPKDEMNNSLDNLITLCGGCHINQHNPVKKRWDKLK